MRYIIGNLAVVAWILALASWKASVTVAFLVCLLLFGILCRIVCIIERRKR